MHESFPPVVFPGTAGAGRKMDRFDHPCSVWGMAMIQTATSSAPLSRSVDAIRKSVERLEQYLPEREDSAVLLDFLEDDLREGLDAIAEIEAHFTDILDLLSNERPTPIRLLDAAEDFRVLNRIEYLMVVVAQLRKRLSQAAGKLREGR